MKAAKVERERLPNFLRLMTSEAFEDALVEAPWWHPLRMTWERSDLARDELLLAYDRAALLMEAVLARSEPSARAQLQGNLRERGTFNAAIAEVMCGARLEALGGSPSVKDQGPGGGPDFGCELDGQRIDVEVYAPALRPREDSINDLALFLDGTGVYAHVFVNISQAQRVEAGLSKRLAQALRRQTLRMASSGQFPNHCSFSVAPGESLAELRFAPENEPFLTECPVGGWIDCFGPTGSTVVAGVTGRKRPTLNPADMAKSDISRLGQLKAGARNVLAVDLTWRGIHNRREWDAYRAGVEKALLVRPELSAVLLVSRSSRLKPAPSPDTESTTVYEVVSSTNPAAFAVSDRIIALLKKGGLLFKDANR